MNSINLVKVNFNLTHVDVIEETQSIVVKDICENIGLIFSGQFTKIKTDPSYQSKLIKVQTNGGEQEVFTIPLSKLNGWLFSINPNKVRPEVKQKLIEYKNECFDVLNNYFNKGIVVNEKFHRQQINGYKSQLSQKNKLIANLKKNNSQTTIEQEIRKLIEKGLKYDEERKRFEKLYGEYWRLKAITNKLQNTFNELNFLNI
ncbi:MAG: hypothetical protein HRT41_02145 [Campylobacteraceae bacterium]|nr:hypothetical protein [Campylobacteraceae bacterium]